MGRADDGGAETLNIRAIRAAPPRLPEASVAARGGRP